MSDHTPEQAAILALLDRVQALEEQVQRLTIALAVQAEAPVFAIPRRLTANPDRGRIARS